MRPRTVCEPTGKGTFAVTSRFLATASEFCEDFMCAAVTVVFGVCSSLRLVFICSYFL
jgi:hypothetical protein